MKFVIVTGNPKSDGLCHSVTEEIVRGAKDGGADVEVLKVEKNINRCHVCGDGWGGCRQNRRCGWGDDGFDALHDKMIEADLVCFITPVYWHEMAENIKCFADRLRRCERGEEGKLAGKPVLFVASAGGTGNGIVNCLHQMEQFARHTHMKTFDFIGINRWNADYKREAAYSAAKAMANRRQPDDTI